MNVLPFVFALLMLLSVMTYAKLQIFFGNANIQSQYICYMKVKEIDQINAAQLKLFQNRDKGNGSETKQEEEQPQPGPLQGDTGPVDASRTINFSLFLNKEGRETDPVRFQNLQNLIKKLILSLYQQQPFFQEAAQERGDLVDQLLQAIMDKSQLPQYKGKITQVKHLANLDLEDPVLQKVMIEMLKGSEYSLKARDCRKQLTGTASAPNPQAMYQYPSLQNFLNVEKTIQPIRLWLASQALLTVIFEDESFVDTVMKERTEMYRNLLKYKAQDLAIQRKKTSEEFRHLFDGRVPKGLDTILNFQATKTQPPGPSESE